MTAPEGRAGDRWESSLLALILAAAAAFRLAELDGLAPFIDESADLALGLDYRSWSVWDRLLHGKLFGYLWFKPVLVIAWDPLYAARLLSALTGVVSVVLTHRLLLTFVSRRAALVGTVFFAFMPLIVFHERLALFDGSAVAVLSAAVLLYLRTESGRPLAPLGAGFLFCIGVLTKAYALLAILLWLPILRRRPGPHFRAALLVGLGFLVCLLVTGLFLAVQVNQGAADFEAALVTPRQFLAPEMSIWQRSRLAFEQLGQIAAYLYGYNGWAFFPVVLLAAILPGRRKSLRIELLVTWVLYSAILSVAFRFLFSRYLLISLPALALLVALAVDDCIEKVRAIRTSAKREWSPVALFSLLAICSAGFVYKDTLIAAQVPRRVLPDRDAYQYLWGGPSGFGLPEIADRLRKLDVTDERKVVCVTRGMGTGTHGAATLPLLLRHSPIRLVHLWLESEEDFQTVRDLPGRSLVVFFVDDPHFLDERMLARLGAQRKLLFEIKGTTGRPDYRLFELIR